ncbi:MAG: type II secretion system major pseudopilin GspG [Minwuiales bacterium]|nr:type II secretion system major pseudopilin GspG [Minwuiales bacterium]
MTVDRSGSCGRRQHSQAGFTLVELLVVLVILGLIAGFATPQLLKYLSNAKTDAAGVQITQLGTVLDLYRLEVGRYPSEDEGLNALHERPANAEKWDGPYVKKAESLIDPWGRPYRYRIPGQNGEYDLYTLGADGREGGDGENQDVTNW